MLFVAALLLIVSGTISAPTAQPKYVSWQDAPNLRGTWDLLITCTFTLVICVYTAVHLNLPGTKPTCRRCRLYWHLRKPKWVAIGILAPEILVYVAWRQWISARTLTKEVNRIHNEQRDQGSLVPKYEWTMTHSFFAGMGGFAVDISDEPVGPITEWSRIALTAKGVLEVLKLGFQLPDIPVAELQDRSRADTIAKCVAWLQAGNLILQLSGRLASRLPITLLEVNTVGHVFCALIIYLFWFGKPFGTDHPILLQAAWSRPLLASWWIYGSSFNRSSCLHCYTWSRRHMDSGRADLFFEFYSKSTGWKESPTTDIALSGLNQTGEGRESQGLALTPMTESRVSVYDAADEAVQMISFFNNFPTTEDRRSLARDGKYFVCLYGHEKIGGPDQIRKRFAQSSLWSVVGAIYCLPASDREPIDCKDFMYSTFVVFLDNTALKQWEIAAEGIKLRSAIGKKGLALNSGYDIVCPRVANWGIGKALLLPFGIQYVLMALSFSTALYGGLHLVAFYTHTHFPSETEATLWQASSLIIVISGAFSSFLYLLQDWRYRLKNYATSRPKLRSKLSALLEPLQKPLAPADRLWFACKNILASDDDLIIKIFLSPPALLYIAARCFIVIEAFISLRSLPVDAYKTPNWSQWIPHI